jgi:hypothetical protein
VSADPAPDSACAPSFLGRPPGQLPSPIVGCPLLGRQVQIVAKVSIVWPLTRLSMGPAMAIVKPAPFVSTFVDAVDQAIREHHPSHGMSAMQRAWLAFCVTAVLVTNSICWARFARASLGTYSLAALSWMFRHSKIPWDKLRDKDSGGYVWGQSLVFLPDVPPKQRPPKPPPNPYYPTKQALALRLLAQFKAQHPTFRVHCITADALYGTATFVEGAAALFGGVQVISQIRSNQKVRLQKREQHVADYFATHPGTPQQIRIRGGEEVGAMVGSARLYVCSHHTKRFIVAIQYEGEETYRYLMASDLTWRTLDIVQGHTLRWLVEVFVQDWKSPEGWSQLTKQPGEEGTHRSVILSLLVDQGLFYHPDQYAQFKHNLPAYPVGSLRAHVQIECLINVIETLMSSDAPQEQLHRFTHALHEVFAFSRSKKHMSQRQLGRLEPTPSLRYRADEVMRNIPILST